jgi:glycerol kinase
LTRGTGRGHIARAAVESIALQTADLLKAMNADSGVALTELRVDGGATANSPLLQFQADILQLPVVRSKTSEITALGAAYLAGLAVGVWLSKSDLAGHWSAGQRFEPAMSDARASELLQQWHDAVERTLHRETK